MIPLLQPFPLRGVTLRHRIVIPPMAMYQAFADGRAGDWHLAHYGRLAMGGASMVMLESTAIAPQGRIGYACLGLWSDDQVAPLGRIAALIRSQRCVPAIQINHTGRKGSWRRPWDGYAPLTEEDARERGEAPWPVTAPSALPIQEGRPVPAALSVAEVRENVDAWAAAARRADAAGFEVLEIHAAHGYLVHQFLSPIANRRTDGYGGDLPNRMRFCLEVTDAVRAAWPHDKPLLVRVSAVDGVDGGWSLDDTVALARALKARGVDAIDCSSGGIGGLATVTRLPRGPGFQVPFAERVRQAAGIPTVAVGLITEPDQAAGIVEAGRADLVAIGREALVNPNWPAVAQRHLQPGRGYADWQPETGWWLDRRVESLRA